MFDNGRARDQLIVDSPPPKSPQSHNNHRGGEIESLPVPTTTTQCSYIHTRNKSGA
jgi:hypothetical protein